MYLPRQSRLWDESDGPLSCRSRDHRLLQRKFVSVVCSAKDLAETDNILVIGYGAFVSGERHEIEHWCSSLGRRDEDVFPFSALRKAQLI